MKGPCDVWFTIAMAGCSFQLPVKNEGRLMPVCQLIAVLNVWSKSTRRRPPGTVVRDVDLLPRIADVVRQVERIGPVPGPDAKRGLKAQGRGAVVSEHTVQHAPG